MVLPKVPVAPATKTVVVTSYLLNCRGVPCVRLIVARGYYSGMPSINIPDASQRPPSLLALPSYLAGSVARIGNARLVSVLADRGLKLPQFAVLMALTDFGELAPHELASRLQTDRSHMSASIEVLAKRKLVRRETHPNDRRRLIVTMTEAGAALAEELAKTASTAEDALLSALSKREKDLLLSLLLRVIVDADASRSRSATSSGTC